jgi:hypothetical protein
MEKAPVAAELEILRLPRAFRLPIVKCPGETEALDRFLLDAIQICRRGDSADLIQSGNNINGVQKLAAEAALVFKSGPATK